MYAVHIRSLTLTSRLKDIVPYEAWTGRKPNVSHLRIFGSFSWAHVSKQVRKGKLESRAVKVRLLGWWTDETKEYRLEDMENSKVITSRDVQFFEDSSPSELAVMNIGAPTVLIGNLNNLIDDAINKEANQQDPQSNYKIPTVPSTDRLITPTHHEPNLIPTTPPPAPKKSLKWNNLLKRDISNHTRKPPERYALLSIDNAIAINDSLNLGFVTVANEPQSF